ncbi:AfsR/SARP family transcriptional regulator [Streptomyces sp. SAJ15]|uniref:AfsR/SARP family transcriptional regulator n=1 Tax=Streptomyces sp. SAJ15 TaxID=2011095 RepID=UPI001642E6E2|nr:AfsR/SARP family transcriptional regulator [Streptomyces sp. SAJ15]
MELGPARQRAVLSALLLTPGQVVAPERLKEAVWPQNPPRAAMANLHSYVSNLRRKLEPNSPPRSRNQILRRELSGYVLDVDTDLIDACRFEQLLRDGRRLLLTGQLQRAGATLEACLALWRGSPYAEMRDYEPAAHAAARLEELRLLALESRWEAELLHGRDPSVIAADLATVSQKFPTRERLSWLHMQALYRAGRQAEALKVYHQTRTLLADEYGVDPGPELQELFGTILRGASAASPVSPGPVG